MQSKLNEKDIIKSRNLNWGNNDYIPSWVDLDNVDLDQFFTKPEIAEKYYEKFIKYLSNEKININSYKFIEPSAGNGSFFKLLPPNKRIGFDLMPLCKDVKIQDFLSWCPETESEKLIFVGNPPFGYRAWLALAFMNHTAKFAEYAAFILPMSFQSDGKGSPKHRVKGMTLVHSEVLPPNSFLTPDGKKCSINALWQIWKKGENIIKPKQSCEHLVDIFTVDLRKERLCGQTKIDKADYFLQRTYYHEPPKLVKDFSEVRYVCGYGIIIKKDKHAIKSLLQNVNWNNYSNLAAHNCRHISMYHIEKALIDEGVLSA